MRFGVLGPLEVVAGAVEVRLSRPNERRLLAALLVHLGEAVATDALIEAVWAGDEQPVRPTRALQTLVSRLRDVLGAESIVSGPAGYRLAVDASCVDANRFERLFAVGQSALEGDPEAALDALDEALSLWRGRAYEEFAHEPFVQPEAVRLDELRLAAIAARVDARLALGGHQELVGELEALVARHPLAERLRGQLMVALYRSGRQADALAAFQSYRRLLADELGLEPSPSLQQLERQILTHRLPDISPASKAATARRAPSPPRLEEELGLPTTRLIGRGDATARLLDALREARLVTLTGPGGVGKTRLAARVAGQAHGRYADGTAACSLTPVRNPDAVPSALATALGIRQRQHRSIEESLVDILKPKQLLLVLDNCEHVIDVAAELVSFLLRCCPRLTVLATSRARLGLGAEQVVDVPPLPVPRPGSALARGTAVELFCERAQAAGVELPGDADAMDVVADICRHLDGLPLAVELAAAHVRAMHPEDIAERLATSPPLVGARLRDIEDRHRSLQAVTDWSYQLLSPPEQELFDGLSVFAGSFDLSAAEAVGAASGQSGGALADLLASLVDKSLLTVPPSRGPTRYTLLETLRSCGREQLVRRGGEGRWRRGHAHHYLHLAEQAERGLASPAEAQWMERLGQDMDNFREARRWALDHDLDLAARLVAALTWFRWRTLQTELELWAEETAERARDHPLTPLLLGSAAWGAWSRGELDRARRIAQRAIKVTTAPEHAQRVAREALGAICLVEGKLVDALAQFEHVTALNRQAGDRFFEAWTLCPQAIVLAHLGRRVEAAQRVSEAETIARELGCPTSLAYALYARGESLVEMEPERALQLLDRAEALARQVGNHFVRGVAGISATTVRARRGSPAEALPRFRELIEHWHGVGNRTQLWTMLRSLIHLLANGGHYEAAAVLHGALEASATAVAAFGPDHQRLVQAATTIAEQASAQEVEAWNEQGRMMDDQEAITYAMAAIEGACRITHHAGP